MWKLVVTFFTNWIIILFYFLVKLFGWKSFEEKKEKNKLFRINKIVFLHFTCYYFCGHCHFTLEQKGWVVMKIVFFLF